MSERPYSRLYWEVMDDPKFDGVRDDPRHFGAWALLLLVADMAYPASALVPYGVSRASLTKLSANGLIDLSGGGRYRIHGMAKERDERSTKARASALLRYSDRSATAVRPHSDGTARQDETRRDEPTRAPAREGGASNNGYDGRDAALERHDRGVAATQREMDRIYGKRP